MRLLVASLMALGLLSGTTAMAAGDSSSSSAADAATPAASANANPQPAAPAAGSAVESELQQMREALRVQSAQLEEQQKKVQALEEQLNTAKATVATKPEAAAAPAPASASTVAANAPASANPAPNANAAAGSSSSSSASASAAAGAPAPQAANAGPDSWAFKGVTFTPIGFFAAETVYRQRALSADVNTPFNAAPLPGSDQYNVSEFNASGRQSRIGMLVQGALAHVKIGGYYEADFLSAGTTSNDNESNSYTLRQRQFWGQAAFNDGWTITGGQMWSLVTQTAKGLDNRTEQLPATIDAQYHVGFSWARQYGVRFAKNFNNKVWLGFSVEEPQTTFKQHGTTTPFLLGAAGNGGGLYNTAQASYSFNMTPDFVVKTAFEPGFGHYEIFGVISTFRDRVYPTGVAAYNDNQLGGGGGANVWFPFFKNHMDLGVHFMGGDGIGRYGTSGLPDSTAEPNGTLALIRSYQGLGTLEFHYPKIDIYFNTGSEYAGREQFVSGAGAIPNEGYGAIGFNNAGCWTEAAAGSGGFSPTSPANCTGDVRNIIEGTAGFWYYFYRGSKGQVRLGGQYSYEVLNTWSGAGPTNACTATAHPSCAPSTNENMFFTSLRYYIP